MSSSDVALLIRENDRLVQQLRELDAGIRRTQAQLDLRQQEVNRLRETVTRAQGARVELVTRLRDVAWRVNAQRAQQASDARHREWMQRD